MGNSANKIHKSIEAQRRADFEAYRRVNELTKASEKLPLAMRNSFDYELGADGELYFGDECLEAIFRRGYEVADQLAAEQPDFVVEQIRRHLEYDEYLYARQLASSDGPDMMLTITPIPDAVALGYVDYDAYDRQRMKSLLRVSERTEAGLRVTSISLDRSDRDGLRAVAEKFGITIEAEDSSEDILFKRGLSYRSQLELDTRDVPRALRQVYDEVLGQKLGGDWFGGRPAYEARESLQFIEAQTDLIDQHLRALDATSQHDQAAIRRARYDFAAALDRRLKGEADVASLRDAGDAAEAAGRTYSGDCPTSLSASSSLDALGFGNKKTTISKNCPICGAANVLTTIEGEVITGSCGCRKEICTGKVSRGHRPPSLAIGSRSNPEKPRLLSKDKLVKQRFGEFAVLRTQTTIGGADRLVIDRRSGQVIAKL
ncbi:MAG TPA: hypothetical protein VFK03_04285 [Candidatus Saccharimonadales bacterium]|nr:hypothetical protein [Candidatus Saccharimonadales bacterium]